MKRSEIRVLLLRAPGTNCDGETARSFRDLGVKIELVQTQKVFRDKNLLDYNVLVFPGGFSYGDYVRSGAIWAKECEYRIGRELEEFVDDGRPVLGICNGFQLLVEAGFLPGFKRRSKYPEAALANNTTVGYQCRWIKVKHLNRGGCPLTGEILPGTVLNLPVAHGEGRFVFPRDKEEEYLQRLYEKCPTAVRSPLTVGSRMRNSS